MGSNPDGVPDAGESYVVFGSALASSGGEIDLATLSAGQGVLIKGIDAFDQSGISVSSAGDVDNDGLGDIIIGAPLADLDGAPGGGESYVVFGSALALSGGEIDLATLSASQGVLIKGIDVPDNSGNSVSSAGDVDNDGLDDIIIGAFIADPDGATDAGESYVISGAQLSAEKSNDGVIDLSDYALSFGSGVLIKGIDNSDRSGYSVSSAGDVDNDGLDDIIIGAYLADPDGVTNAGESYVVFGSALAAASGEIDLAALGASDGVLIKGIDSSDLSGFSVSSAGDVDNDGLDDIIIGAYLADPDGVTNAGESYVVFGSALAAASGEIDLAALGASDGVLIKGIDSSDLSGFSVSSAGDVDNDGLDDIIIGARSADPDGATDAGESYVVFGSALAAASGEIDLAALGASDGVLIKGIDSSDLSGFSVSSAGDVDNDGLDDIIIGAYLADPDGVTNAGESYVVFGSALAAASGEIDLAALGASDGVLIKGIDSSDFSGYSVSSAGDVDNDGLDDIIIGARSADPDGATDAGESYVVFGSALAASGGEIDLATLGASDGVLIKGDRFLRPQRLFGVVSRRCR